MGLLVCAVGGWLSALPAAAGIVPAVDRDESGLWAAGTLILLGVIGVPGALLLKQRHRFRATKEQLEVQIITLMRRCANLETQLETQRLDDEYRRKDLEAKAERQRRAVAALRDSEYQFRNLSQQLPVGVFLVDVEGRCQYVNERWCQMSGLTAEQATGLPWMRFVHPDEREQVLRDWRTAVEQESGFAADHRIRGPSGRVAWLGTRIVPLRDRASRIVSYLGVNMDIAGFKRTEETLRASETRFRGYFELSLVGVALTGPDKRWWEVNDRLCEILGYRREQLLRLSWAEQTHPDDLDVDIAQFERVMARRIDGYSLDKRFLRPDGALVYASVSTRCVRRPNGMVDHFVTVVQDITERKQAEDRIRKLAYHDALTGLPNRELLTDRLLQAVARANRDHTQVGVLLVDLDLFKRINDTLGHSVGDQLLREVAARLQGCVRSGDTVSRQGGDEFAIVLPDLTIANDDAARIARRILDMVARPCHLDGKELHASCSIGISVFPRDGRGAETLLKNADIALYRAKDMERNNYQFYLSGATVLARERLDLENSLRYAVDRRQLVLYYQPKWDFHLRAITGAEALIRWNHPQFGLLSPARFIPIAEDSSLILPLGEWVLREAVREIGRLHRRGFPGLRVAVNLSGRQFHQSGLVDLVHKILSQDGFDSTCLELELTESILMHHTEDNIATLKDFKTMGLRLAIDDFGTGYSSLSYLQRFPVDVLKIDRSFVMHLPASTSSAAIVDAIVTLGHGLQLDVVAEGVETVEQLAFLQAHGCDEGQGFHFGRPLPLEEFQKLLHQDRVRAAAAGAPPAE
ncbi:MAG: EAL domain-containing protein [Candidatus Competibacteraceae bacterium]|nr:EAL domain-containing protein [Candidatus Competibacteraceae bacterium]